MIEPEWTPFGLSAEEQVAYEVLVEDVPYWMREPLIRWLLSGFDGRWMGGAPLVNVAQAGTRVNLGIGARVSLDGDVIGARLWTLPGDQLLRLVDYLLSVSDRVSPRIHAVGIDSILTAGRSKWTVGERMGRTGLVARVPIGVQETVEGVVASSEDAGAMLARAWGQVHGLDPNDSGAYADAVRSVEIAAIAVVQPNHGKATLGTVLGQMRADGDWRLPLRGNENANSPQMVTDLVDTLWHGHRDRHGSPNYSDVTHEEARAAVTLAATLVDWFTSGALARRSSAPTS